jgi:carboxymethylenebutenolidase
MRRQETEDKARVDPKLESAEYPSIDRGGRDMIRRTIDIKTQDGICDAYVSCPESGGPFPGVLIFMDGAGVRPAMQAIAERIAANGFCVLLPNMYYRARRAPVMDVSDIFKPENRPKLMALVGSLSPERVVADAGAFLAFLAAQAEVKSGSRVGLTGYCMGGAMVVRTSAAYPDRIGAGASHHGGRLVTNEPDSPHLLLDKISAELYFGHADNDEYMPPADIARFDQALQKSGVTYESEVYTAALHGYTMTDFPVYNAAAADKHWRRLLGLFGKALKQVDAQ